MYNSIRIKKEGKKMKNRYYWLGDLMRKNVERIWQDVTAGKAVAINDAGCAISGDAASGFSSHVGSWKVCYLDRVENWTLSDGVLKKEQEAETW